MARGVQENEVFAAADALLAAGERPTVERVRLAVGRGSPNTIGPLLDGWWAQLAERLQHRLALPAVPEAVGTALAQVWELALAAGRQQAEAAVAPERQQLAEAQAALAAQLTAAGDQVRLAQTAAQAAEAGLAISAQRAGELASQVDHLQRQSEELRQRHGVQETQLQAALSRLEQERAMATAEREALQAHQRQSEDRAYGEIDRLRQDLKAAKAELSAQARAHVSALRTAEQAQRAAEKAQHAAEREAAAATARVQALAPAPARKPRAPNKTATPRRRRATPA